MREICIIRVNQMKEEDLSFTNMCHLMIIIVIKLG